jgi:hypothetical protein
MSDHPLPDWYNARKDFLLTTNLSWQCGSMSAVGKLRCPNPNLDPYCQKSFGTPGSHFHFDTYRINKWYLKYFKRSLNFLACPLPPSYHKGSFSNSSQCSLKCFLRNTWRTSFILTPCCTHQHSRAKDSPHDVFRSQGSLQRPATSSSFSH